MTDGEQLYVNGVHDLLDFIEEGLPSWVKAMEARALSVETLPQAYDVQAEIRLKEAELVYR